MTKENMIAIIIIGISLIGIIVWLYFTLVSLKLEKRIENHTIKKEYPDDYSIADKIIKKFHIIKENLINQLIRKSDDDLYSEETKKKHELFANQIISCILTAIIYLITTLISKIPFSLSLLVIAILIGILIPNIITNINEKIRIKKMEKDLLKVVSLMNNLFQSGKSIIQVIDTIILEIDGPLKEEFIYVKKDMENGLSFKNAFDRLYKRTKLEDIKLIMTSLTILSKTGGDIVKVFSTIEENLYTRKNLENELKAVIASSELVFKALVILPVVLYGFMALGNQEYLTCYFESTLGIILFMIIVLIYIIYILIIKKIMKIEKY